VPSCCYPDDYGAVFTPAEAASARRRFERRGVTGTGADVVALLEGEDLEGRTVLEVGAGVGDVLVTLVEAGAVRAVDVELVPAWAETARSLFAARGLDERLETRIGDFVDEASALPRCDVVVLNRVVCCYPDWRAMLGAAARTASRTLLVTVPVDRWWTRAGLRLANVWFRMRGLRFRVFVHPEPEMRALLRSLGFTPVTERAGAVWRTTRFDRAA
jgi:SAM-dependent methyltransferase